MQHKAVYLLFFAPIKTVTTTSGTVQLPPSNVAKLATLEGVTAQKI